MNLSRIQQQSRKEYFLRINRVVDPEKVRQSACITVDADAKPEGEFGKMHLPGSKCAVGSFKVKPHQFGEAWDAVCRWLADSGYQPSDGLPYEYYPEEHEPGPEPVFTVDICVPVKPFKFGSIVRDPYFTNRIKEIKEIHVVLNSSNHLIIIAPEGMANQVWSSKQQKT